MQPILLEKLADARFFCIDTIFSCAHSDAMDIHHRIKERRLALRMSMAALAKAAGVSAWQTVQQWEKGGTAPNRNHIEKVAAALEVTAAWLMHGDIQAGANPPESKGLSREALDIAARFDRLDEASQLQIKVAINVMLMSQPPKQQNRA